MSNKSKQDALYAEPREAITDFIFDQSVVRVFQDMIGRSVPGYSTLLSMIPVLIRKYNQPDSCCYDLGCSLGAATLAMRHSIDKENVKIIALDNSQSMINQCAEYIAQDKNNLPVELKCANVQDEHIKNASIVVMNFTLQFIDKNERLSLLENIYQGLKPGGVFLLSEKIKIDDASDQQLITDLHHEFKKANGYSDLEISQKRSALENILIPESVSQHKERLEKAGFKQSLVWFQCFNFISILAIK
jgi:tRNA (cmo5U34)-methyltransferase